jgi:hypothetical protein
VFRQRRAVDIYPRLRVAQGIMVQCSRDYFLAGSSLTRDQDSYISARYSLDQREEIEHRLASDHGGHS